MSSVKPFLGSDFLLDNEISSRLYHKHAASMPILDYHNHLSPKDIAEDTKFLNLTEAWLEGDHYKWRAMRTNGISEHFCTGDAAPEEKFAAWAETVPNTLRNPLYHWTHLELKNYFGLSDLLDSKSGSAIYDKCSAMLQQDGFGARGLLKRMNVEVVCTTDDPTDSLEYHKQLAGQNEALKMYPTFRPDKAYAFALPQIYNDYLDKLALVSGIEISTFENLIAALEKRITFFNSLGCRSADHGLEAIWFDEKPSASVTSLFDKIRSGLPLTIEAANQLRAAILFELAQRYHALGWVQQFHLGAQRSNNSRMLKAAGPDTGFDSIGDFVQARHLANFLDALDANDQLPKTILYNLNPANNEVFATMAGNFNDGSIPGKIQFGSAWWFLDQKDGMERQMNVLSAMGLLSRFVGMITDSRSFLSFPRHEYFRRILCNLLGRDVVNGEIPESAALGPMVENICCHNTKAYFNF